MELPYVAGVPHFIIAQLPGMRRSDACNIKTGRCCCCTTAVDTNILVNIPDLLISKIGIA